MYLDITLYNNRFLERKGINEIDDAMDVVIAISICDLVIVNSNYYLLSFQLLWQNLRETYNSGILSVKKTFNKKNWTNGTSC